MVAASKATAAQKSDAARRDVAINVVAAAQKYHAVSGRIGLVIFQLVVWNDDLCSDVNVLTA
jgi:hypothetical protein